MSFILWCYDILYSGGVRRLPHAPTVDFRNFIVFVGPRPWHIEIRHRVKKTSTINLCGFETLKLKIRRLKLWKPTVAQSERAGAGVREQGQGLGRLTANLPTNVVGFRGFYSSIILILRGRILRYKGNFPESSSQAMLVDIMLVGRLGVPYYSGRWSWSLVIFRSQQMGNRIVFYVFTWNSSWQYLLTLKHVDVCLFVRPRLYNCTQVYIDTISTPTPLVHRYTYTDVPLHTLWYLCLCEPLQTTRSHTPLLGPAYGRFP